MLGCCIPRDPSKQRNQIINEALERDRKELNAESKLLLLGKRKFCFFKSTNDINIVSRIKDFQRNEYVKYMLLKRFLIALIGIFFLLCYL